MVYQVEYCSDIVKERCFLRMCAGDTSESPGEEASSIVSYVFVIYILSGVMRLCAAYKSRFV
jgi:hypothetical protein